MLKSFLVNCAIEIATVRNLEFAFLIGISSIIMCLERKIKSFINLVRYLIFFSAVLAEVAEELTVTLLIAFESNASPLTESSEV